MQSSSPSLLRSALYAVLAAVLVTIFCVTYFSAPASATPSAPAAGQPVTLKSQHTQGFPVRGTDPDNQSPRQRLVALFHLEVGGVAAQAYCLELHTSARYGATGAVQPWSALGRDESTRRAVTHIALNSYPHVSLAELQSRVSGVQTLSVKDAISATQAAIWHFTDGFELDRESVLAPAARSAHGASERNATNVATLYDHLVAEAEEAAKNAPGAAESESGQTRHGLRFGFVENASAGSSTQQPLAGFQVTATGSPGPIMLEIDARTGTRYAVVDAAGKTVDLSKPVEAGTTYYLARPTSTPDSERITVKARAQLPRRSLPAAETFVSVPRTAAGVQSQAVLLVDQRQTQLSVVGTLTFSTTRSTPTPSPQPTVTVTATATPNVVPSATLTATPTATPSATPTVTEAPVSEEPVSEEPVVIETETATPILEKTEEPTETEEPIELVTSPEPSLGPTDLNLVVTAEPTESATPTAPTESDEAGGTLANTGLGASHLVLLGIGGVVIAAGVVLVRMRSAREE